MAKYRNRKITRDGETFDSVKEYRRWCELKLLERAGKISELKRQVTFELIPAQKVHGKVVERACTYIADFVYKEDFNFKAPDGPIWHTVVEDTKGYKTREYIIKRKLMLYIHGIRIQEV